MQPVHAHTTPLVCVRHPLVEHAYELVLSRYEVLVVADVIPVFVKVSNKVSNAAIMTHRSGHGTISRGQGTTNHHRMVLAQGIEP